MPDKPQVNIFAICDRVIHSKDGKHSLLGIFDTIHLAVFPTAISFFLFTQITAPQGEYRVAVHLCQNDGIPQKLYENQIQVIEGGAANIIVTPVLRFDQPGLFEFRLYIDGNPALTRPFHVVQSTAPL